VLGGSRDGKVFFELPADFVTEALSWFDISDSSLISFAKGRSKSFENDIVRCSLFSMEGAKNRSAYDVYRITSGVRLRGFEMVWFAQRSRSAMRMLGANRARTK
jgi:hypothetical protein